MFPTSSVQLSSQRGLVPASWKNITMGSKCAGGRSPEMTFRDKPVRDGEGKAIFFFSSTPGSQVSDPTVQGALRKSGSAITVNDFLLSTICRAANDWWLFLEDGIIGSSRTQTSAPFLHVKFKQCMPILEDRLITGTKVKVREEILACDLKIWEHSDTLELMFSFFFSGDKAAIMNTHIVRTFVWDRVGHQIQMWSDSYPVPHYSRLCCHWVICVPWNFTVSKKKHVRTRLNSSYTLQNYTEGSLTSTVQKETLANGSLSISKVRWNVSFQIWYCLAQDRKPGMCFMHNDDYRPVFVCGTFIQISNLFFFFFAGNFSGACGVYCFLPSIKRLFYKGLLFCGVGGVDPLLSFPKVFLYLLYKIKISFF